MRRHYTMGRQTTVRRVAFGLLTGLLMLGRAESAGPDSRFAVYFHNSTLAGSGTRCERVFPLARTVPATPAMARAALTALFAGPSFAERGQGYYSPFSPRTAGILKNIRIIRDTAYVDLRDIRALLPGVSSSCGSAEFLAEVDTTLRQFPSVQRVIFAIEAKPRDFYEWIQAECDRSNDECDTRPFTAPLALTPPRITARNRERSPQ